MANNILEKYNNYIPNEKNINDIKNNDNKKNNARKKFKSKEIFIRHKNNKKSVPYYFKISTYNIMLNINNNNKLILEIINPKDYIKYLLINKNACFYKSTESYKEANFIVKNTQNKNIGQIYNKTYKIFRNNFNKLYTRIRQKNKFYRG